jgi:hypothetical protein
LRGFGIRNDVEELSRENVEPALSRFEPAKSRLYVAKSRLYVDDRDRLPTRGDRVADRFRSFDHDLVFVLADRLAQTLEPRVPFAGDQLQWPAFVLG